MNMGTHASDLHLITRAHHRTQGPTPAPVDSCQFPDAERDVTDGGGAGFMLVLLTLVVSALAWWLI